MTSNLFLINMDSDLTSIFEQELSDVKDNDNLQRQFRLVDTEFLKLEQIVHIYGQNKKNFLLHVYILNHSL